MSEDWALSANAPSFTLFKRVTPEEAAASDEMVDIIVYNRWKKQERRLYSKLKAQKLAEMMNSKNKEELDGLSDLLGQQLSFLKSSAEDDPLINDLIARVDSLKVNASNNQKVSVKREV